MSPTRYFLIQHDDEWMIRFADEEFGPYKSKSEAMLFAVDAARTKATYLNAQFVRLRSRRGPKKAVCAVAASILTAAYHMLKDGTFYHDLGPAHFDRRQPEAQARRLMKRLAELGFSVQLQPVAAGT